jgi:hypothetical protein
MGVGNTNNNPTQGKVIHRFIHRHGGADPAAATLRGPEKNAGFCFLMY